MDAAEFYDQSDVGDDGPAKCIGCTGLFEPQDVNDAGHCPSCAEPPRGEP